MLTFATLTFLALLAAADPAVQADQEPGPVARQLMTELGFDVARADRAHSYLSRRLLAASIPQVKQAGSDLNTLRGNRKEADYDLHRAITQTAAGLHVRMAEQIVQFLNTSRQEPTRTQVTAAMKVYERDVLQEVTWHP